MRTCARFFTRSLHRSQPNTARQAWTGLEANKLLALENVLWGTKKRPRKPWIMWLLRSVVGFALSSSELELHDATVQYSQVRGGWCQLGLLCAVTPGRTPRPGTSACWRPRVCVSRRAGALECGGVR